MFSHEAETLPFWDLSTVLTSLMEPPFELLVVCPLEVCSLYHLSIKTAFLVAITLEE